MPFLISISSLSFLVLATMFFLRWFGCSFKRGSVYYKIFKKSDKYLNERLFYTKRKALRYKNNFPFFVYIGKFLLFQIIKLYDILNYLLKRVKIRLSKRLDKISLKEKGKTVSEYLRNISDYKRDNNDTKTQEY